MRIEGVVSRRNGSFVVWSERKLPLPPLPTAGQIAVRRSDSARWVIVAAETSPCMCGRHPPHVGLVIRGDQTPQPMDELTIATSRSSPCVFCGVQVHLVEDGADVFVVEHDAPHCAAFTSDDVSAFIRAHHAAMMG